MNRRLVLPALAAVPAAFSQSPSPTSADGFAVVWRDIYANHWRNEREYTLAVLEAMPPDGFDFKPNPVQRSFGDQLRHLAHANVRYLNRFNLVPVPTSVRANSREDLDSVANPSDKEAVRKFVASSFDYVSSVLAKLGGEDLARKDYQIGKPHTGADVLMRAYTHTAHHRGQAIVYLRVKGIAPPAWRFEPS